MVHIYEYFQLNKMNIAIIDSLATKYPIKKAIFFTFSVNSIQADVFLVLFSAG